MYMEREENKIILKNDCVIVIRSAVVMEIGSTYTIKN